MYMYGCGCFVYVYVFITHHIYSHVLHIEHNQITGFTQQKLIHPDSDIRIDQFIIRKLDDKIETERCIRLQNGFLSTVSRKRRVFLI